MSTKREHTDEKVKQSIKKIKREPQAQPNKNPCPTCSKNNDPAQSTHSHSSSKKCPYHKKNKNELAKDAFNKDPPELFTIKAGCEQTCRVDGLQKQISIAVEKICDVTFEAALLANYHYIRCMDKSGIMEADCFGQTFFYACMQFVCGKNSECPHGLRASVFADLQQTHLSYAQLHPDNLPIPEGNPFWHTLSTAAVNMEKDVHNHMVANFTRKTKEYIIIQLHEVIDDKVSNEDLKRLAAYVYKKQAGLTCIWPPSVDKVEWMEACNDDNDDGVKKTIRLETCIDDVCKKIDLGPKPVTDAALFTRPHEYMPFFFKMLRFFEAKATAVTHVHPIQKTTARTMPPLSWIKRKGRTKIEDWKQMTKARQRMLVASIRSCILDSEKNIMDETPVCHLSTASRSYLDRLVCKTRNKIQTGTFQPKMCVSQKGGRLFTLCPLHSFQQRYIEINARTLRCLIKHTGYKEKFPKDDSVLFWNAFNFTRIGVKSLDNMYTKKQHFWNTIRSDGTVIDFLFGRPKRSTTTIEKSPADIRLDLTKDRLWGVDPGITDVFVAADGNGDESHEVRKTSTKEFYHISGWNKARELEEKWKKEASPELRAILDHMPSAKTTNISKFDSYIRYVLKGYRELVQFYDDRWRILQFQRYRGRQKALTEVCKQFTTGSKKYPAKKHTTTIGSSILINPPELPDPPDPPGHTKRIKWKHREPHEELKRTVVAFGDGMFSMTMKGKKAGVSQKLFRALHHHDHLDHIVLIKVPEFHSSKVCSRCQTMTLNHMHNKASGKSLHAVLKCKKCDTVWNRDVNAARNL